MEELRIIFMGTPDFAVAGLEAILKANYKVVGVITAPDRPAGRGQKLRKSAVKVFAEQHDLKILQPTNLKSASFIEELTALKANLQVVVAFRMLPKVVWQMPELGTFNLHASLLPDYRGAAPINWAIINGEVKTGVSTFFIDEKIDTGAIIEQKEVPIAPDDNAGTLHDKLMLEGSKLIVSTLELIKMNNYQLKKQKAKTGAINTAYKLDRENTRIDWSKPLDEIYNKIRGLDPYPAAWTILKNDDKESPLKVYKTAPVHEMILEDQNPGAIKIIDGKILVKCQNAVLELLELQIAGKRKMPARDLLNGFSFTPDAKVI